MAKAGYSVQTGAAVALSAATARSVLCVIAPAQFGVDLCTVEVGFDGVTASAVPVLCELCTSTLATNSTPGTNNTTATVNQTYGRAIAAGFTGFYASTAGNEPTVLTPVDSWTLTPNGGLLIRDWALGKTYDTNVSAGFVLRCTAPAAVNVRATFNFERC
jgi:hypothetical protein